MSICETRSNKIPYIMKCNCKLSRIIWSIIYGLRTVLMPSTKHIPVVVPIEKAVLYRPGRKNKYTQNVIAVYSFDMRFTWIWPDWEGFMHDWRMFTKTTTTPVTDFPHSPGNVQLYLNLCLKAIVTLYCYNQLLTFPISKYYVGGAGYLKIFCHIKRL